MIYDKGGEDISRKTANLGVEDIIDTIDENMQKITPYIRDQLKNDAEESQLTLDLPPVYGSPVSVTGVNSRGL